jgi:hypothetical protein
MWRMPSLPPDPARIEALVRAHTRWRIIFVVLALVVPLGLYGIFERQARRLDALADHGRTTSATVVRITRQNADETVFYEYVVGGKHYDWSVRAQDAPFAPGESFAATYLPEDPSLSRPGADGSRAAAEASSNRAFTKKAMLGVFAFFALNLAMLEVKARKLKKGKTIVISPAWLGRVLALLFLVIMLATNGYADVLAVQQKAFGATPFGIPVSRVVSAVELLLFLPYFWIFEHVMRIVSQAVRDQASLSKSALASYILNVHKRHPELARSRVIAIAGLAYFVLLAGSWIAFASSKGI